MKPLAKCTGPGKSQEIDLKVLNKHSTGDSINGNKYEVKLAQRNAGQ